MTDEEITAAEQAAVDDAPDALVTGVAQGGPLDGAVLASRRPAGVLLVDRPAGQCWLYDWRDGGFYARSTDPAPFVADGPEGTDNGWRAAEQGAWDVQAAPWVGGDPDDVDVDAELDDLVDDGQAETPAGAGVEVLGAIIEEG